MPPRLSSASPLSLLGDRLNTALMLKDLVLAPQADLEEQQLGQYMIPPAQRRPNAYNSWELLQEIAMERQRAFAQMAKKVRAAGGTEDDVKYAFDQMNRSGKFTNPGDLIRGSGRMTPRQGLRQDSSLVLNPTRQLQVGRPIPRMPSNPQEPSFFP